MLLMAFPVHAYQAEIDGIYYDFSSGNARVTYREVNVASYSGDVVIPSTVTYEGVEYTVREIRDFAFSFCTELTSVYIPNTVRTIGEYAFRGCTSLTSFNFPDDIHTISPWCFAECTSLDSVVIPDHITEIQVGAFLDCTNLASVTIPDGVTKIGAAAFKGTQWFESQPDGLVYIGPVAYKYKGYIPNNCEIVLRDGTVSISGECFWEWDKTGLTAITIPSTVRSIGFGAFYNCGRLTSVTLPEGLEEIEDIAFAHCSGLTSAVIPASVTSLGERVFSECYELGAIRVEPGNTVYDSRNDCNAIILTSNNVLIEGCYNTVIPEGVRSIGRLALSDTRLAEAPMPISLRSISDYGFQECRQLTSVVLPDSLSWVGSYAFRWCTGLTTLSLGSSVSSIGTEAFAYCAQLTDVYSYATRVPSASTTAFKNSKVDENTVLHVPYELLEQYRTTAPWSSFKEIVPLTLPRCEAPTITLLQGGRVAVESATPGAVCVTSVTACSEEPLVGPVVSLNGALVLYTVTSYATAEGYDDSEVTTATFRWDEPDRDVNGDGVVDIDDVTALINAVLGK